MFNYSYQFKDLNLNESILPRPKLGASPSLLPCLREHPVAISGDIKGMFNQVRLPPEDKPLLRFVWRDTRREDPPDVSEWQVLPFGTTCSPCCAIYALQKHVSDHRQCLVLSGEFCLHGQLPPESANIRGGQTARRKAMGPPSLWRAVPVSQQCSQRHQSTAEGGQIRQPRAKMLFYGCSLLN